MVDTGSHSSVVDALTVLFFFLGEHVQVVSGGDEHVADDTILSVGHTCQE